jgi:hypothetical protein
VKTSYELWCISSRNWAGSFESLEEILDSFAETAKEYGPNEAEDYYVEIYEDDKETGYLQPEELTKLVNEHIKSKTPRAEKAGPKARLFAKSATSLQPPNTVL